MTTMVEVTLDTLLWQKGLYYGKSRNIFTVVNLTGPLKKAFETFQAFFLA